MGDESRWHKRYGLSYADIIPVMLVALHNIFGYVLRGICAII